MAAGSDNDYSIESYITKETPIGISPSQMLLDFNPTLFNATWTEEELLLIDSTWEEQQRKFPNIFNASKFRLHQSVFQPKQDPVRLTLSLGLTDYKSYIGSRSFSSGTRRSKKLGVSGVVITADGNILLLKRSKSLPVFPGMLDVPGGHPEPSRIDDQHRNVGQELPESIISEVVDEVNIPRSCCVLPPMLLGTVTHENVPSLVYRVECTLTLEKVQEYYDKGPEEGFESTQLTSVSSSSLSSFNAINSALYTPAAKGALSLMFQNKT